MTAWQGVWFNRGMDTHHISRNSRVEFTTIPAFAAQVAASMKCLDNDGAWMSLHFVGKTTTSEVVAERDLTKGERAFGRAAKWIDANMADSSDGLRYEMVKFLMECAGYTCGRV